MLGGTLAQTPAGKTLSQADQNTPKMNPKLLVVSRFACVLAFAAVTIAWGADSSAADHADFVGIYVLASVDGKPMPASISHEGATLQVRSGTLTANTDGTCSTTTVFVPPTGTEIARSVRATYTRDGGTITMQWEGAGMVDTFCSWCGIAFLATPSILRR